MQQLSEQEFDERIANGAVLIDFSAEWCGPCKAMVPTLERMSREYDGRLRIYSVDIDKAPSVAAKNGVMSVPTMMLFQSGKAVERMVGVVSERELKKRIDGCLGVA